ncbi:MAG TPA: class II glutamine amidotransferase [Polyangiaceae bacterium]|jgi:glutamine amidotransferase
MARLFGLLGNRADLTGRVLAFEREALRVKNGGAGGAVGWGLGFYQGGEVLIRRRPIDERDDIDVAQLGADVRAEIVVGHVRQPTVGTLRTENTHPFRYRQWLYAQTGTVSSFDQTRDRLVQSVPEFLRAGIRGDSDAEIVFQVFLSFLHDAGKLDDLIVDVGVVHEAIRGTLRVVDAISAEVGGEPAEVNLIVSNGDIVVAAHRRKKMALRTFAGRDDAEALIGDDQLVRRRTPELAQVQFALVASDFDTETLPPRWNAVKDRAMVSLTRAAAPKIEDL